MELNNKKKKTQFTYVVIQQYYKKEIVRSDTYPVVNITFLSTSHNGGLQIFPIFIPFPTVTYPVSMEVDSWGLGGGQGCTEEGRRGMSTGGMNSGG